MKKICIILGTRPEIIKLAPVMRECKRRRLNFFIIHTNQHYSENLDKVFFRELALPRPRYNLNIGSGFHGEQTGRMIELLEKILQKELPALVCVQGDTNTVLAGSLAAAKLHLPIAHVEAGLRSHDRTMPEEINRILSDHCADLLFAPTKEAAENLKREGIPAKKIFVTGNTVADAVFQNLTLSRTSHILKRLHLVPGGYFLTTIHRPENVDHVSRLRYITRAFSLIIQEYGIPIVFPMHPRTEKMLTHYNVKLPSGILVIPPVSYFDFLHLERNARIILTDSGGVQEEACILSVPCVTLRENTERPETLIGGGNIIAGVQPKVILEAMRLLNRRTIRRTKPFGDGNAAIKILDIIRKHI